ncbi:MAG: methionyl-tRNA formyltransferase, partial [Novosphingobium sp.]|nr:methionyl-tRNA formyltransferase [Novosphingobium sp.]
MTGVTIMQMEAGLDTGPMLAVVKTPVDGKTAGELTAELSELGANLMIEVLADLPGHAAEVQPAEGVTYAHKIDKAEARIDWLLGAEQIERQVRAFAPVPGAWFEFDGERCKILATELAEGTGQAGLVLDDKLTVACGTGAIRPTLIQRAGRPAMATADMLRGWAIVGGHQLA